MPTTLRPTTRRSGFGNSSLAALVALFLITSPATNWAFETTDQLPPLDGRYTNGNVIIVYTIPGFGTVLLSNIVHRSFTTNYPPPVNIGDSTTHSFGSTIDLQFSTDGGSTWVPASGPASVTAKVTRTADNGGTRNFDTELLALSLQGGTVPAGAALRESPTLASLGKTAITAVPGGFDIQSYFDVFTELTLNAGANWFPANNSERVVLQTPPPVTVPTLSEWGLIVFGLSLLIVGSIYVRRLQVARA